MAQQLIRNFLADLTRAVELPDPVVEFGSMQVEHDQDGDFRPLFAERDYTGTDMREGPGVDRIEDLRALSYGDGEVGTALCLDTLEHCEDPPQAVREMHRVVADGGVCVISSVMLFAIHGYPNDYFRFTPEALRSMLGRFDDVWVAGIGDPHMPVQVVGVGAKGRQLGLSAESFPSLMEEQRTWDESTGAVRMGIFMVPPAEAAMKLITQMPRLVRHSVRVRTGRTGTRRRG